MQWWICCGAFLILFIVFLIVLFLKLLKWIILIIILLVIAGAIYYLGVLDDTELWLVRELVTSAPRPFF